MELQKVQMDIITQYNLICNPPPPPANSDYNPINVTFFLSAHRSKIGFAITIFETSEKDTELSATLEILSSRKKNHRGVNVQVSYGLLSIRIESEYIGAESIHSKCSVC